MHKDVDLLKELLMMCGMVIDLFLDEREIA